MKISIKDTAAINAALADVNGKAKVAVLADADAIAKIADIAVIRLDMDGISLKDRVGAIVSHETSGPYREYAAAGTSIKLMFGADGKSIYLIEAKRSKAYKKAAKTDIRLRASALQHFRDRMESKYGLAA